MKVARDGSFVAVPVTNDSEWSILTSEMELELSQAETKAQELKTKLEGLCRERLSNRARNFYCRN